MVAVSAIVSVYKAEKFIRGCLEDLLSQSIYQQGELEIVIIDSNSPEKESDIILDFQSRYSGIRYTRTAERETLYQAWNRGIEAATGRYITNANCDDRHRNDALSLMREILDAHPEIDLVYGDVKRSFRENATFEESGLDVRYCYKEFSLPDVMLHYQFGCQPVWRRSLKDIVGFFNPEYKAAGDWEFNFRFNLAGRSARHIPEVLGVFYENPDSVSVQGGVSALEQQLLREQFCSRQNVCKLYELSGWPSSSNQDQAAILLDFAKHALQFNLPWCPDQVFSDPVLANFLYTEAQRLLAGGENQ